MFRLTSDQRALVTRSTDRTKAALSGAEWRYLFKLRYERFPRASVEADPVVAKALATIAQDTPSCAAGATTRSASVDVCNRFVNVDLCWKNNPVAASTVPCFVWSMLVAGSAACGLATPGARHVDAQAWDDAQDGRETEGCEAPCIAGGSCSSGTCKCTADEAACPGGCGRQKSDVVNCGGCGITCTAGTPCIDGVCGGGGADAGADAASDAGGDAGSDAGDGG